MADDNEFLDAMPPEAIEAGEQLSEDAATEAAAMGLDPSDVFRARHLAALVPLALALPDPDRWLVLAALRRLGPASTFFSYSGERHAALTKIAGASGNERSLRKYLRDTARPSWFKLPPVVPGADRPFVVLEVAQVLGFIVDDLAMMEAGIRSPLDEGGAPRSTVEWLATAPWMDHLVEVAREIDPAAQDPDRAALATALVEKFEDGEREPRELAKVVLERLGISNREAHNWVDGAFRSRDRAAAR